jgi:hypothetical protein
MADMNENQFIDRPWGASVFGAASVDAAPDLARLLIHIKDVDAEQIQNVYRSHGQSGGASGDGDLAPGKITVSAGVVLGFSLIGE